MDISPGKLPLLYYRGHILTIPLHPKEWKRLLCTHPDRPLIHYFISSLTHSFRVGFKNPPSKLRSAYKNLVGTLEHPQVGDDYLQAEIAEKHVIGPFCKADIPCACINRFGVTISLTNRDWLRIFPTRQTLVLMMASQKSYAVSFILQ